MSMEFKASELHLFVCWNEKWGITVVARVDDFLRIGAVEVFMWLYGCATLRCIRAT